MFLALQSIASALPLHQMIIGKIFLPLLLQVLSDSYNWDLKNDAFAPCTFLWCQQIIVIRRFKFWTFAHWLSDLKWWINFSNHLLKNRGKEAVSQINILKLFYCLLYCDLFQLLWKATIKIPIIHVLTDRMPLHNTINCAILAFYVIVKFIAVES